MNFDYLIIGAGTTGCVLANRLTEKSQNTVGLFEARSIKRYMES